MGSAVPSTSDGKEEQFLFRCQSDKLAHRIREVLRGSPGARKEDLEMELTWGAGIPSACSRGYSTLGLRWQSPLPRCADHRGP